MAVTLLSSLGTGTLSMQHKAPMTTRTAAPSQSPHRERRASTPSHGKKKKTCLCSPSTHAGAFRCSFHRSQRKEIDRAKLISPPSVSFMRRLALANSLAGIGVDKDLVKRPVKQSARPHGRQEASPRPSRLSA